MKKTYIIIAIIITIFTGLWIYKQNQSPKIQTPNKNYSALISDTPQKREKGLSGTKKLENNKVMLFIFEKSDHYGIWMKDMLINIDVVYLDDEWNVINYFDDVSPSTYPTVYYPERLAKYVIEMPAGQRLKSGLDKGVKVYYK